MTHNDARQIQAGDVVVFEGQRQTVESVTDGGLWAPYFTLDQAGLVSHVLVDSTFEHKAIAAQS